MKQITIIFILLAILTTIQADSATTCVENNTMPCQKTDQQCLVDFSSYNACLGTNNCAQKVSNNSAYAQCIQKCPTSNQIVQNYINTLLKCLSSSRIQTFTFVLILVYSLLY
ncbi:hypothetical protein TTHERM_001012064 (macronuclear) [Tetrahymena thermophila SB210]|uniref:Transmembrane protein n=1 Tax=Tetrahymena thermophila (strain SB210) TaxID=312017 RepID=W7XHJ2_TETTS|nr:hypothetical protein TTHERM_001012064 [Tetrahymena thermophila SB210]EWS76748.1 hypothetical protein TTHERM_001012064 [Tetrahymena thermophila SB210]|eukprot:XP_012650710.1 hypothetical protein TTHERM_001012064 [Tetrahymena thermophila SB210]